MNHAFATDQLLSYDIDHKDAFEAKKKSVMTDIGSGLIPVSDIANIPIKYLDLSKLPNVPEHNLMTESTVYKPFRYNFGYLMWERQNQAHWLHHKIKMSDDIKDWNGKLVEAERNLMTHIFRLFVQNDVLVNNVYIHQYARIFKPNELQLAFSAIANMESIHEVSYAYLLTELGIPDVEYSAFMEYAEMNEKYNFTAGFRMDTLMGIAVAMLVFGAFTEGLQLFASFAVLFNFSRHNKLKGMGQIVSLSVRDESLHVAFVAQLFKHFMNEFGHLLDKDVLKETAYKAVRQIVHNEHRFTDLAFELGPVEDMTPDDLKAHICHIADMRLQQFGLDPIYNCDDPFESWINSMMGGLEMANFFEQRATEYSKAATRGTWAEAFA